MTKTSTKNYLLATLLAASCLSIQAYAQPGKDGAATISTNNTVVNTYTSLTANASAGATSITVAANGLNGALFSGNLSSGDLILIIQMQGATIDVTNTSSYGSILSYNNAGNHEFVCVSSITGANTINLSAPLTYNYTANGKVQVVRIPRFTTLTVENGRSIRPPSWDGTTGGIAAIETTGNITLSDNTSNIRASGRGFRGGVYADNTGASPGYTDFVSTDVNRGAQKGESIAGSATDYAANGGAQNRGAPANGGGGGNQHNAGGGGGANGNNGVSYTGLGNPVSGYNTAWNQESANFATSTSSGGGRGGYTWASNNGNAATQGPGNAAWGGDSRQNVGGRGGRPLNYSTGKIFFGGGGGAGDGNNSTGGDGGRGGGLVFIIAGGNITGNGHISADGSDGEDTNGSGNDAPGGGGAGGTVIIYQRNAAGTIAANVDINATGGDGGNQSIGTSETEGPGGGGGGGYVAIRSSSIPTIAVTGGGNGTSDGSSVTEFPPNGATMGASGQSVAYNSPNPTLFITMKGTVLADANGGTINGTGTNLSSALYISAVQGGTVIGTAPVQADGSFTINALPITLPASTCNLVLHNNPAGQTTAALPANYLHTAEGTTNAGDGTANGLVLNLTSNCAAYTGLLYGVNKRPTVEPYTGQGWTVPPGSTLVNVPSEAFDGTDEEDGTYSGFLNGRTVTLYPATNATLYYYDGTTYNPITANTVITNFNSDNVYVDPTVPSGSTTVTFQYTVRDDAGVDAVGPATVTMGFSVLLPATGFNLQGKVNQQGALQLSWTTQSEQNTAYFEIELSNDGSSYKAIGKVAAAGNSATASKYAYQHPRPLGNKWYVRIKLVDKDGSISYSNVTVLQAPVSALAVSIAPNPTKGTVWVNGIAGAKSVWLTSANGSVLLRQAVNADQVQLDLSRFADGLYILQVVFADGQRKAVKVHKQ